MPSLQQQQQVSRSAGRQQQLQSGRRAAAAGALTCDHKLTTLLQVVGDKVSGILDFEFCSYDWVGGGVRCPGGGFQCERRPAFMCPALLSTCSATAAPTCCSGTGKLALFVVLVPRADACTPASPHSWGSHLRAPSLPLLAACHGACSGAFKVGAARSAALALYMGDCWPQKNWGGGAPASRRPHAACRS